MVEPVPLLTPAQVAVHLNVSTATVRNYLNSGELRGVRVGARWRVDPTDLEAWIERNKTRDPWERTRSRRHAYPPPGS
ncbi:DNA-binding protein [Sphaerisporangium cinnabarinum]|nr:DNA-binding protein [Sphaerisporangium cinnabarinum]